MASEEHGWKIFYAYADPEAGESGVIYSSLNWLRVSDTRATENYVLPDGEVISERTARHRKTTRAALIEAGAQIVKRPGKRKFVHFEGDRRERRALRQALRYQDYDEEHCWQYDIRLRNRAGDLKDARLTEEQVAELTVHDFEIRPIFKPSSEWRTDDRVHQASRVARQHGQVPDALLRGLLRQHPRRGRDHGLPQCLKGWDRETDPARGLRLVVPEVSGLAHDLRCHGLDGAQHPVPDLHLLFGPGGEGTGHVYQACNFYYCGLTGNPAKVRAPIETR